MFAALNIYKPKGITSHDVVSRLRRIYGLRKIGHLGTLDPLAEGVLPVCLGQATRLIEYFPDNKRYTAEITLGRTTTTLDSEGETVSITSCEGMEISESAILALLPRFTGTITQQVPLYSAVHVGGKKLYELARQGKTADLPSREIIIHALTLLRFDQTDIAHPILTVDVHCSSGTYIRSLARDIGEALGCGAYLSGLVRTGHGCFSVEESIALDTLAESTAPEGFLLNPVDYLALPVFNVALKTEAAQIVNGMKIQPQEPEDGAPVRLKPNGLYMAVYHGQPLAVVQAIQHRLKPVKVFQFNPRN